MEVPPRHQITRVRSDPVAIVLHRPLMGAARGPDERVIGLPQITTLLLTRRARGDRSGRVSRDEGVLYLQRRHTQPKPEQTAPMLCLQVRPHMTPN